MISITLENMDRVGVEDEWNFSNDTEYTMHSIHTYPAKFPAFIAKKAFDYAEAEGVNIEKVADIFCGCGTVALEAKTHRKDFWGCDINPVATLIAKVKRESYDIEAVKTYFLRISAAYPITEIDGTAYENANERLRHWCTQNSYTQLLRLKTTIESNVHDEKYLDAFFISILEQDYENYEVIFINDGSTDRTENIVYKYKEKFEERNIRFVYLKQENGGQAKAMNLGFPYIQGKYFIWPDSDDELYRNNISEKVKYMEQHPDIPLAMSWADYVDESGNVIKRLQRIKPEKDNFFEDLLFSKNVVFCPGIYIMRTDIFFKYVPSRHINESRIGQNYQILLPVAYHEKKIGYIDKILYKYILHKNSHSNKDNNNYEKTIRRFQEHENTLYDLVKNICDVNDQNIYTRKVFVHFNRFYLRLANEYGMKSEVKVYYNKLKVVGENGIKQKIYYIMGMLGIKAR